LGAVFSSFLTFEAEVAMITVCNMQPGEIYGRCSGPVLFGVHKHGVQEHLHIAVFDRAAGNANYIQHGSLKK
jgi:hypothetical protein